MRKAVTILAATAALGAVAVTATTGAQAQYYGGYAPRYYAPPVYAAPVYRPRVYVTPGYGYGGGYSDYRRFGDPSTRDSLATCAYC